MNNYYPRIKKAWELSREDAETFLAFDAATRNLIIRMLDEPNDDDWLELERHEQGAMIAAWLLTLPAYAELSQW